MSLYRGDHSKVGLIRKHKKVVFFKKVFFNSMGGYTRFFISNAFLGSGWRCCLTKLKLTENWPHPTRQKLFKVLFVMSTFILKMSQLLLCNSFWDLSFKISQFQLSVAYESVLINKVCNVHLKSWIFSFFLHLNFFIKTNWRPTEK